MVAGGWGGLDGVTVGVGGHQEGTLGAFGDIGGTWGHGWHLGTLGAPGDIGGTWGGVALGTQGHEGDRRTWFGGRGHPGGNQVAVGGHLVTRGDTWGLLVTFGDSW